MTNFLIRNSISKTTPVQMYCDNLSGVDQGNMVDASYQKWVGIDNDVYGDIRQHIKNLAWTISHIKGHQAEENLQQSLPAKLNNDADRYAKEYWQQCKGSMMHGQEAQNCFKDLRGSPILLSRGFLRSLSIKDTLHDVYDEVLYEKYNRRKLGNEKYDQFLHKERTEVLKKIKISPVWMAKVVHGWYFYSEKKFEVKKKICECRQNEHIVKCSKHNAFTKTFLCNISAINMTAEVPSQTKSALYKGIKGYLTNMPPTYTENE